MRPAANVGERAGGPPRRSRRCRQVRESKQARLLPGNHLSAVEGLGFEWTEGDRRHPGLNGNERRHSGTKTTTANPRVAVIWMEESRLKQAMDVMVSVAPSSNQALKGAARPQLNAIPFDKRRSSVRGPFYRRRLIVRGRELEGARLRMLVSELVVRHVDRGGARRCASRRRRSFCQGIISRPSRDLSLNGPRESGDILA